MAFACASMRSRSHAGAELTLLPRHIIISTLSRHNTPLLIRKITSKIITTIVIAEAIRNLPVLASILRDIWGTVVLEELVVLAVVVVDVLVVL
jgi:hypothetical protein